MNSKCECRNVTTTSKYGRKYRQPIICEKCRSEHHEKWAAHVRSILKAGEPAAK